jgi:signal transduction histidine kinase/CheY-like chemotaxis protein
MTVGQVVPRPRRFVPFDELGRHLAGEVRRAWPLDVVNAVAITAGVLSHSVVVWFHIVFLVQALAALVLPFRRFAARLAVWTTVSAVFVAWSVVRGETPAVELSELPLLTTVLILIYLGAQARSHVSTRLVQAERLEVERSQHELESLRHQIEQGQRLELLGRASLSIAHDLRNVLAIIGASAAELNEEMQGRVALNRVLEILNATDRALSIVSDLQLAGRQRPINEEPIDLRAMTNHFEPLLRRLTPKQIDLHVSCTDHPVCVRMDRTSLLQVLMNLIGNATDAIDGEGSIWVTCERVIRHRPGSPAPRTTAVLTVADSGRGIAGVDLAKVFEAGFTTKSGDHSGLGLATVWRIVDRWQGSIDVESSPSGGTTVRMEFPLFDEFERRRALVVLDDAVARQLLADELSELDFEVLTAADALEACDLLLQQPVLTVAVLDSRCAADVSFARLARLDAIRYVSILGENEDALRRIPANPVDAALVVSAMLTPRPIVPSAVLRADRPVSQH